MPHGLHPSPPILVGLLELILDCCPAGKHGLHQLNRVRWVLLDPEDGRLLPFVNNHCVHVERALRLQGQLTNSESEKGLSHVPCLQPLSWPNATMMLVHTCCAPPLGSTRTPMWCQHVSRMPRSASPASCTPARAGRKNLERVRWCRAPWQHQGCEQDDLPTQVLDCHALSDG